ncbi:phosphotransferase [uncultured Roseobacter sp.]|uniref:phosphotransferase n=1 Tax=uncultured Roseobacter sp. TaxID=114847 RepID=UPI00262949F2|nr:phosphotransferase [uncultured Roseobacter sp.]
MSLQPSSFELARDDESLPGLQLLLDEAALARELGAAKVTRTYLRYKPGVSCVAGLCVTDARGEESWLCAKAYPEDRFQEIKGRKHWRSGPWPVALLDDICVAFIPPQRDRKLKTLAKLLDPDRSAKVLTKIMDPSFTAPKLNILRYKPNRRLVAQVVDHASGRQAILKIQSLGAFDAAKRGAEAAMMLGGPKVIATDPKRGAVACDWIPGAALCLTNGKADPALYRKAGQLLAKHHLTSLKLPDLPRSSEIRALKDVTADLSKILPHHASRLSVLAWKLTKALLKQPTTSGLIHGDFSADQIVHGANGVSIIDWDRAATGDQGRDIGSFLARLDMQELAGLCDGNTAKALRAAFLEGYQEQRLLPASYPLQHICHLALLLTEPFRTQTLGWQGQVCALMNDIEARLAKPLISLTDPALPHLADALDRDAAGALLKQQAGLILTAPPTLYRHKPGKRAMVRYECQTGDDTTQTLLGKMRSRGQGAQTPALHTAFRTAGLDGHGPVGVPRVIDLPNDWNMWFMEEVPGTCLRDLQDDPQTDPFVRTGAALGHLHGCGVLPTRRWTQAQELDVLTAALGKAGEAMPRWRPRLQALVTQAEVLLDALPNQDLTCIHRDFYPDQVIVDVDQVWVVDLDLVALGDPAIDVGNFLAHLTEYAMRTTGSSDASKRLEAAFLRGYQSTGPDLCQHRIRVFRTISLLRHIHISRRFKDRKHITKLLLEEGETLLAQL